MRIILFLLIAAHGAIHFIGAAKAFGVARLPQLTQPISKPMGIAWMLAGAGMIATAALLWFPRTWWPVALWALVLSQVVIFTAWNDARYGTVANLVMLLGVLYGAAAHGPLGLRANYRSAVDRLLPEREPIGRVADEDVSGLPPPVQRYVRLMGAVGQPTVHHFRARWTGRIRASPDDDWMEFTAEQYNFVDTAARFFMMDARKSGLPVDVYHAFEEEAASMQGKLLSLVSLFDARGEDLTRAETVTLLNDLCLLAPAALVHPSIQWTAIDRTSARATYTVGANTVSGVLTFNEKGELLDFVSDDRLAASPDGTDFVRRRWSTPVLGYTTFGSQPALSSAEARWHLPDGEFVYAEMELREIELNPTR